MSYELIINPDPAGVAEEAAVHLLAIAQAAVARRGRFRVALSGGGTPGLLYGLLVQEPYRSRMPWTQTQVFWGDERYLPAGHAGRNDTSVLPLLAQAGLPASNLHPAPFLPDESSSVAAERYENILLAGAVPGEPLLDLVLLGLGTDGHTASLFPDTPTLDETERLVAPNRAAYEDRFAERITLTLPAINAAAVVMFLVTGESKREILKRVLGRPEEPPLPAQRVRPASGRLLWLVDQAAAPSS